VLAAEIQRSATDLNDSAVLEYTQCVAGRLGAFLGGCIFVPASLFLAAENEAEMAGMLAHSIAHLAERQDLRLAARVPGAQVAAIALYIGWQEEGRRAMIPPADPEVMRSYEVEADHDAVKIMTATGIPNER